ncbi:MAG: aconitate hydratase [Candidatus Tokpelaia sp. JSC188]|nr:MAG: aconitate hydratase [Candidatus Tokpelaia sp. JSC188]
MPQIDSFKCRKTLDVDDKTYVYCSLTEAEKNGLEGISSLPFSMKILLENLLRFEDGRSVKKEDIQKIANWLIDKGCAGAEIAYRPARVLMQDFTGVPALVDLAAMRDAMLRFGSDPEKINPLVPVDLVIDHSVIVDSFGDSLAFKHNMKLEYQRNGERYRFLKWGQQAFRNFRVVPPGTGICHQVNLEYLAQTIWINEEDDQIVVYPDTCVGTDSHTTMVNGLGVLAWGVGGIEAEAAMLGQSISMLVPEIIGFRLTGRLKEGVTATDLVLTVTQILRKKGVVGKFIEFFGSGIDHMTLADRATISNMAPEYGATCGFFPIDNETIRYLKMTGRDKHRTRLAEIYARTQGMWRDTDQPEPVFSDVLELNMDSVVSSMAGPKRPEACMALEKVGVEFKTALVSEYKKIYRQEERYDVEGEDFNLGHGDVVIAAITSCTNTSNPSVLINAGLLARNAVARGLKTKPWVKTSLAPGSQVVEAYLVNSGLQKALDALGFNLVGFGCTTCIGNSGPLSPAISKIIDEKKIIAAAVLSGNRNFEGRVSSDVQANYLAAPPLVVAHALAGTVCKDLTKEPLGIGKDGDPVFLHEIWPSSLEIQEFIEKNITRKLFTEKYANVFSGNKNWQAIETSLGTTYLWDNNSTYVRNPPYFENLQKVSNALDDIVDARILGLFGDKITTDHISPAGSIKPDSPAGEYLMENGIKPSDFNQYGTRRGNHEVMVRGTFANIRIRNFMMGDNSCEGGYTVHYPSRQEGSIYDVAMLYKQDKVPLVVFAGTEYGNGSSRDWAAKGANLLGIRAVIAQSFERIHRSNLIGMGVIPFVFEEAMSWKSLGLRGDETITIRGVNAIKPRQKMIIEVTFSNGIVKVVPLICRIDTVDELEYLHNGGILQYVLHKLAKL